MYTAYIHNRQGDVIEVWEDLMNVSSSQKTNQPWDLSFTITKDTPWYTGAVIAPYSPIIIRKQYGNDEVIVMKGVLVGIEKNAEIRRVIVKSTLHLLQREKLESQTIYTNTTIEIVTQSLASLIASKTGYTILLNCDIIEHVTDKEFRFGMSIYDVLKELAGDRYEFDLIRNGGVSYTLAFMQSIGTDRTDGPWSLTYSYDISDLTDANMDYTCTIDYTEVANTIHARRDSTMVTQSDPLSIIEYWPLEDTITPSGDVAQEATKALEERKEIKRNYKVTPRYPEKDYFQLSIGDLVAVHIYENDTQFDYTGVMKVLDKTLTAGDMESYKITIGTDYLIGEDLVDILSSIKRRVSNLELS